MKKRGAVYWTISKLIKWILLIVLLALIIVGVVTGALTPLFEQVGGKINEVALLLGIGGNAAEEGCKPIQYVDKNLNVCSKDVASGSIKVCNDGCYYKLIDPKEYMGFSEFSVDKVGASKVINAKGVSYSLDVIMPGYNPTGRTGYYDSGRQKYMGFLEFMDDLYVSSELEESGISKNEFFDYMAISPTGFFTITITPKKGFLAKQKPDIVFQYDGSGWTRSVKEDVRLVNEDEVYTESYESYLDGLDVFWNYNDGRKNFIFTEFDADFKNKMFDELELTDWLDNKTKFIDDNSGKIFRIEVEVKGWNHVYYYKSGKWRRDRWYGNPKYEREDMIDLIMGYNLKNIEMTWKFGTKKDDEEFTLISDIPIKDKKSEKGNFKDWANERIDEFLEKEEKYEIFVSKLNSFLQMDRYISVNGAKFKVEAAMIFIDDKDKLCVVNVIKGEEFENYVGIYRENQNFIFMDTYGDEVERDYPWVYVDDRDWKDFLAIKDIFVRLDERCRVIR